MIQVEHSAFFLITCRLIKVQFVVNAMSVNRKPLMLKQDVFLLGISLGSQKILPILLFTFTLIFMDKYPCILFLTYLLH